MIDQPTNTLKLVEYNAIASSFGCLSNKVHRIHEYVREKYEKDLNFNYHFSVDYDSPVVMLDNDL